MTRGTGRFVTCNVCKGQICVFQIQPRRRKRTRNRLPSIWNVQNQKTNQCVEYATGNCKQNFQPKILVQTDGCILGFESDIDRLRKANSFETFALPAFYKTDNWAGEILYIQKKGKWGLEEIYDKGNGPEAVVRSTGYKGSSPFVQRVIGVKVHGVRNYVLFVDETTSDWRTLICENLRLLLNDLEKNGTVHVLCSKQNSLQNEIQNAFYIQWIHQNDCSRPITKLYRGSVNEQIFYPQDLVTIGSNI